MPSLTEYIRTLKNYNPGITDKSIKIYLLKDGWNIDEIENAFKVINGVTPTPTSAPASTPAPTPAQASASVSVPSQISSPISIQSKVLEVQPDELVTKVNIEEKKSITYPTFEQVKEKANSSTSAISNVNNIEHDLPIIQPKVDPIKPVTLSQQPQQSQSQQQSPSQVQIPTPQPVSQARSEFGAPKDAMRPQFSYKDIMGPASQAEVGVPVYKPGEVTAAQNSVLKNTAAAQVSPLSASEQITQTATMPEYGKLKDNTQTLNQIAGTNINMTPAQAEAYAKVIAAQKEDFKQGQSQNTSAPAQNQPSQPLGSSPVVPQPKPQAPLQTTSSAPYPRSQTYDAHNSSGGKMAKVLGIGLLLIAILGGGGYGYMNYVHGVYLFVKAPFEKENFLKGFAQSIISVDAAVYNASVELKASPKEESLAELDLSKYEEELSDSDSMYYRTSSPDLLSFIPTDAKFNASISGIYNKQASSKDGKFGFKGSYTGDGLSVNVDVESVKVGPNLYARINTFPAFFIDLSKVKDKWILITEDELQSNLGYSFGSVLGIANEEEVVGDNEDDVKPSDVKAQLVEVLEFANQKQVFEVVGDPVKNTSNKSNVVYQYEVKPNLANIISFAKELPSHMKGKFGDKYIGKNDDNTDTIKQLESPEFAYYFNYYRENTVTVVGVDTKGRLAYIDMKSKVAFKDSKFDKQLETNITLLLDNVNGKNEVYAPSNPIPYLDAYSDVTGRSKEMIQLDQQSQRVREIKYAIEDYMKFSGEAPVMLEDLKTSTAKLASASTTFPSLSNKDSDNYYLRYIYATSTRPIYRGTFTDVYTGQRFTYQKTGKTTYQLIYEIKLPPVPKDIREIGYTIGEYNYRYSTASKSIMSLRFVGGPNTATELDMSKEAAAAKNSDKDSDGLSDSMEAYLGTDLNKADTDGDKVDDLNEINKGTNPKGS